MWGIELRGLEKSNRKASANAVQRVHVDYFPGFLHGMEERTRRVESICSVRYSFQTLTRLHLGHATDDAITTRRKTKRY